MLACIMCACGDFDTSKFVRQHARIIYFIIIIIVSNETVWQGNFDHKKFM